MKKAADSIFKGFFYTAILTVLLVCSIVGMLPLYLLHLIALEGLRVLVVSLGRPVPTNINELAVMVMFVLTWIGFSYAAHNGYRPNFNNSSSAS